MNFFDGLMTPLNKGHCMYFYVLGYAALTLAFLALLIGLMGIYKQNYKILGFAISYFFTFILGYYLYRLNYSVCLAANK
jgi:hypothetical protein